MNYQFKENQTLTDYKCVNVQHVHKKKKPTNYFWTTELIQMTKLSSSILSSIAV